MSTLQVTMRESVFAAGGVAMLAGTVQTLQADEAAGLVQQNKATRYGTGWAEDPDSLTPAQIAAVGALVSTPWKSPNLRAAAAVKPGPQGWTLLNLGAGVTSTDAAVRINGNVYEFVGTLTGTITSGMLLATMPLGLERGAGAFAPVVSSTGICPLVLDAMGQLLAGTVSGSPTWISIAGVGAPLPASTAGALLATTPTLPIMRIDTSGAPLPAPNLATYIPATIEIDPNGNNVPALSLRPVDVSGHGNSTWAAPKKSMKIRFPSGQATSVLGMPADRSWRALANYYDQTLIRNAVAFEMARRIYQPWTPRCEYCEVFLNGEYIGVYQMTESVKNAPDRLPVSLPSASATGLAGTGTFLLEINERMETEGEAGFRTTPTNVPIQYEDPDPPSASQITYLQAHMNTFDAALFGGNWLDPVLGYAKYVDMESWANWFLVSELTRNQDATFNSSCKLYKLPDTASTTGKLVFGPLWDSDLSLGNGYHSPSLSFRDWVGPTDEWYVRTVPWLSRMMNDPAFIAVVQARWAALYAALQGDGGVIEWSNALALRVAAAATEDARRWGLSGDSRARFATAMQWLKRRVDWMLPRIAAPFLTNLVTNPRAAVGTTGYGGFAGTGGVAAISAVAGNPLGGNAVRWTWSQAATGNGGPNWISTPVEVGKAYTVVAVVRCSKKQTVFMRLEQKNAGGGVVSASISTVREIQAGEVAYYRQDNVVAAAGITQFGIAIYSSGAMTWAPADWLEICGLMIFEGSAPVDLKYADPGTSIRWTWNGSANASTSRGWPM